MSGPIIKCLQLAVDGLRFVQVNYPETPELKKIKAKMTEPPVSKLNNMMTKIDVVPTYELLFSETRSGAEKFVYRVTCPTSRCGTPMSVDGPPARTKKEAKHAAADLFMKKFLTNGVKKRPRSPSKSATKSIVTAAMMCCEGRDMLENICRKNKLGRPKYTDEIIPSRSSRIVFRTECKLRNLRTEGKGKNKIEARLHATARMMQVVMETESIRDILKSGKLTISGHVNDIVCSSDNAVRKSEKPSTSQSSMIGKPEPSTPFDVPTVSELPDPGITLMEIGEIEIGSAPNAIQAVSTKNSEQGICGAEPSSTEIKSAPNEIRVDPIENTEQRTAVGAEPSSSLLNNNGILCINSNAENNAGINRNLTRLQAVSRIDRTLGSFEKQLNDKIQDSLVRSELPYERVVTVLCHNYQVLIRRGEPPKIFEDGSECCDKSIIVACLTKLLLDLKDQIVINPVGLIK